MPTSRPGKFTVIQTNGLARRLTFFPTENEPIFRYRFQGLKPDQRAHFARIQTKANSQYAIQKTGVNSGSGHADHQAASAAIPFLRSPDPRKRSHFSTPRPPRQSARRRSQKYSAKPICNARARAAGAKVLGAGSSEQPGRAGL